jgi:pyroglutamyl-peptidase
VLKLLPGIHARPPRLPTAEEADFIFDEPLLGDEQPPPEKGYDFVLHVGAGSNGAIRFEQLGHKTGYRLPGVDDIFAPVVNSSKAGEVKAASEADKFEKERMEPYGREKPTAPWELRGFAEGYEAFPEELYTEVDVAGLIAHLKRNGETVCIPIHSFVLI